MMLALPQALWMKQLVQLTQLVQPTQLTQLQGPLQRLPWCLRLFAVYPMQLERHSPHKCRLGAMRRSGVLTINFPISEKLGQIIGWNNTQHTHRRRREETKMTEKRSSRRCNLYWVTTESSPSENRRQVSPLFHLFRRRIDGSHGKCTTKMEN